jgi:preprotein translocase subunit SecF
MGKTMEIDFIKYRKIFFLISGILVLGSIISLTIFGLRLGIDFTGGSILEVEYLEARPSNQQIKDSLGGLDLGEVLIQPTGEKGAILRMKEVSEDTHQEILERLGSEKIEEIRFEAIGPVIGQEVKEKTKLVIILALASILIYVTFAFRGVSRPVKSWQYGIATLIALFHDVLIPLGLFAVLGKLYSVEISVPIITALLTVFGYSVNDTVVVFDRIRENLLKKNLPFNEAVNESLNQTLSRSVSTSLTTLFVLLAIFFFGGYTLRYFSLALILGIALGTYSSICLASLILVSWLKWKNS